MMKRILLASTVRDTSLLLSFINSLPAFYEGAERVGDELAPTMKGKDGHIVRVDGDERILNPTHAKMIPKNMSNFELARLGQMADKQANVTVSDNSQVVRELRELKQAIESKPVYDFQYDAVRDAVISVSEKKGKIERRIKKNSSFFSGCSEFPKSHGSKKNLTLEASGVVPLEAQCSMTKNFNVTTKKSSKKSNINKWHNSENLQILKF
jgi:ssDNA-binding Zn-finger/Zn-ribbon topoisomerase 1